MAQNRSRPKQYRDVSGDFLAFAEDVRRNDTKTLTLGDETFHLRGPALLSDDEAETITGTDGGVVAKARVVIDDYDRFAAAGGTAMMLMTYYDRLFDKTAAGESEASSTS